jgi:pyrroloquinoline quinone biosynthesis protein D
MPMSRRSTFHPARLWPGIRLSIVNDAVPAILPDARPRLPHGVRLVNNEAQGGWVLLAPERIFKADAIAAEVLKRCTGEATFAAIVDDLAKTYAAPRERILADVTKLLRGLADKRLLEL